MSSDPNKKSARTFSCRDVLWETFEQMARELECSVDYLVNESMKQYARQRSYGSRTPYPGMPAQGGPSAAPPPLAQPPMNAPAAPPQQQYASVPPPPPLASGTSLPGRSAGPPPLAGHGASRVPPPPQRPSQLPPNLAPPPHARNNPPTPHASAPPPGYPPRATQSAHGQQIPPAPRSVPGRSAPPPIPRGNTQPPFAPPPQNNGGFPPPPHQQPQTAQLAVVYQGDKVPVNKDRFVIGRGKQSSDLTLKDPNVSRQHAMIEFQNGVYFMVDMGSTNGVEYNGQRIARKQIAEGDVFRICDHDLRFTYR